jgi:superfamily II DNA or RNA helicase
VAGSGKQRLLEEIARQRAMLESLERQREEVHARLRQLEAEAAIGTPATSSVGTPRSPGEKVALFRALFRGRDDVFPRYWQNERRGTTGYAPACANEWVRGVCEKPRVRCGECPNQAFVAVSDEAILDHLQGRHVVGVYPMLSDDTCWFLAADFDKESWAEDVAAFVRTCRRRGLQPAVERSRSGNGAHVWFFFASPVQAAVARRMGCFLITETMRERYALALDSYDRLFPNQDTLPRGGFGNLIALPLQHVARQQGNTVFIDDGSSPFDDQWAFLASVPRIAPATVEAIAAEGARLGQIVGVQISQTGDTELDPPWELPPSRRPRDVPLRESVPSEVRAVLAQRLFVEKGLLPSPLLNEIKRLAAFQNPEFYRRQKARQSTALTPRVIACVEDFPQHLALPRGCVEDVRGLLEAHGSTLRVDDRRAVGASIEVEFRGELTAVQQTAATEVLKHDLGVLVAPPGFGKTVVGAYVAAARRLPTLVLVHRRPLLDQWRALLALFLGTDAKAVGQVGGGKKHRTGWIDVAMIQSLLRNDEVDDVVAEYRHVIVDECHHLPAVSFERVAGAMSPRFVLGLTATPHRRDGHHPITHWQCGPVRHVVDPRSRVAGAPFSLYVIRRNTAFATVDDGHDGGIQGLYGAVATDRARNELLLNDIISAVDAGRSPIVLTERKEHLEYLASKLRSFVRHVVVLQGGGSAKERRQALERLAAIVDGEERVVLATGRYVGEGFDDPRLDTLFLAMPIAWRGTLVQYAGRLHRPHPGKREVRIYDYVDQDIPVLARMFEKRWRGYRALGYQLKNAEEVAHGTPQGAVRTLSLQGM